MSRLSLTPRRDRGDDPDYRFTFANERTFLAWIRTSLALVAGGLALTEFLPALSPGWARRAIGVTLALLGLGLAVASLVRWARNEEVMREGRSLSASRMPLFTVAGMVGVVTIAIVLLLTGGTR